jgi:signal transduction histidine kinase
LIASVSHELRTPLTPILGFSETLLRHDGVDSQTRQAAEVIHRNARHLSELVDDLLRTSRARRGALPVDPEAVAVGSFIDEMLQGRAEDNIEVHVDSEVAVWVDRTHLTQIVTNLLDNAVRYGRPPVRIEVASEAQACRLSVIDHGDGVPEWFVSELFDDFAQASRGDGRSGGGLGLGLPIARTLARANDGDLTYADEDVGARFTLRLPTSGADQISMIVPTSTMRSCGT